MIGNDVVDLKTAKEESNWRRAGFIQKIFTSGEQQMINDAFNPEIMIWTLWSRKEAVYKIVNRETRIRSFKPWAFECIANNCEVIFHGESFFIKSEILGDEIHTIASRALEDLPNIVSLKRDQIIKKESLPFYSDKDGRLLPASVSHHGRYYHAIGLRS